MTVLEVLKRADERMKEWNKTEEKKKTLEEFLLNQFFEDYWKIRENEARELVKELSAYMLDIKEDNWSRCSDFIEHLKEYTFLLEE